MTSSAASDTRQRQEHDVRLLAGAPGAAPRRRRRRACGRRAARRPGCRCAIPATASATEPASPTTVDVGTRGQLGAHAGAEQGVVVDEEDPHAGRLASPGQARSCSLSPPGRRARRHRQVHLGALPWPCCAARTVPPWRSIRPRTESAQAVPVVGRRRRGRSPTPRSRTKTFTASGSTSAYTLTSSHPGVLGRVDHRLAGGQHEGAQVVVQVAVADHDRGARRCA